MSDSRWDYRELDDVIHSRIRLSVMAILASVEEAGFTFLRERVGATDGNLSTHLKRLDEAGYVEGERELDGDRPVTRYHLTPRGREAFTRYLHRMESLLGEVEP